MPQSSLLIHETPTYYVPTSSTTYVYNYLVLCLLVTYNTYIHMCRLKCMYVFVSCTYVSMQSKFIKQVLKVGMQKYANVIIE